MHLLDEVRRFLTERGLTGCRITAALSGGADSICLLHALHLLKDALALDLHAIHVQHNLRGAESGRDEQFCRDFCDKLGVPLTVVSCDVMAYAKESRTSVETAARECRYAAFAQHCEGCVATAHTASDNLETVLLRMARGTGLKGLCGIPPVRGQFIRPLLHITREQVEAYCHEMALPYVTDSTNESDAHRRNFLRHHVVPKLRECNPSLAQTCADMTETLRLEEDFLEEQAKTAFEACRLEDGSLFGVAALHPAIQRRCIGILLETHGIANRRNILTVQALLTKGGSVELVRGGLRAYVSHGVLYLAQPQAEVPRKRLQIGENCIFQKIHVEAEVISRTDAEKFARIHTMFANSVLDYDIINGNAELHGRTPGLRLKPHGSNHTVSIRKWLNACVAPVQRNTIHYLSDAQGLLWAEGLGAAAHAAVTAQTQRMLYLRIYHETDTNTTQQAHADVVS